MPTLSRPSFSLILTCRAATKAKRMLKLTDLPSLPVEDEADNAASMLRASWEESKAAAVAKGKQPSLMWHVLGFYRTQLALGFVFRLLYEGCNISIPFLLRAFVTWLQRPADELEPARGEGYGYAVGLAVLTLLSGWLFAISVDITQGVFQHLRSALMALVFRKAGELSADDAARMHGRIAGLHTNETSKLKESLFVMALLTGPIAILGNCIALYFIAGPAGLVALALLVLFIPFQISVSRQMASARDKFSNKRDARLQSITDLLNGIRICKFMGWEPSFDASLRQQRDDEVHEMSKMLTLRSAVVSASHSLPLLLQLTVFGTMYAIDGTVTAQKVFPTIAVLNMFRALLTTFALSFGRAVDIVVILRRFQAFLELPSRPTYTTQRRDQEYALAINVPSTFGYKPEDTAGPTKTEAGSFVPLLDKISVRIPKGKLTMVVGATAGGKSTLIHALIGEATPQPGLPLDAVTFSDRVAFAAQDAWIMNATVRKNVVMDEPFDEERYCRAVCACKLDDDLAILSAGDRTEIGERGVNLSGGQKARVALARCVYSSRPIVVLDDPLSAVDPSVAKALFFGCIQGPGMAGRTRLLVTHHVQFLPFADSVVAMDGCAVAYRGDAAGYARWAAAHSTEPVDSDSPTAGDESVTPALVAAAALTAGPNADSVRRVHDMINQQDTKSTSNAAHGALIKAELAEIGTVSLSTLFWFARRGGLGWCLSVLFAFVFWRSATAMSDVWLSWWTSRSDAFGRSYTGEEYMKYFGIIVAIAIVFIVLRQATLVRTLTNASSNAHAVLVAKLLSAPLVFFDTTPGGRIMSRFSKDIETMDVQIPEELNFWLSLTFMLLGMLVIIAIAAYPVIPVIVLAIILFVGVSDLYGNALRSLRRLENIARSPCVSAISELVMGLQTIRPFGILDAKSARHDQLCNDLMRAVHSFRMVQFWAAIVVGLLGLLIGLATNILVVALRSESNLEAIRPSGGLAALSVTYGTSLTTQLMYYVVMNAMLSAQFSAVERVKEYSLTLPSEPDTLPVPPSSKKDDDGSLIAIGDASMSSTAATGGTAAAVQFSDVTLRYRPELPTVLNLVSFAVPKGMRIGVVGRTGSGKSTIMLALFRLINIEHGAITVHGRDIREIPLRDLRSMVTIIPQDPVLFLGTVRTNIDPFNEHSDERLLAVLGKVRLADRLGGDGLEAIVESKGSNFSVGQRQLLCLARALLRQSSILLLDEATASVDFETDDAIQHIVRSEFPGATTLVIAHRLSTVMDSDRILVLRDGAAVEFDTPAGLLNNSSSVFASMVAAGKRAGAAGDDDDDDV
jgi:ABC-type multidrug transport system fused ATPase/permease subunit